MGEAIPPEERLARLVNKTDGCWLWTGGTASRFGYGSFNMGGGRGTTSSHRAAYELWVGPIPNGLCVLHKCDNPLCCRPDHLFLGTRTENMRDKVRKRRQPRTFTDEQVAEIRRRKENGESMVALAAEFGAQYSHIQQIVYRRIYKYVA